MSEPLLERSCRQRLQVGAAGGATITLSTGVPARARRLGTEPASSEWTPRMSHDPPIVVSFGATVGGCAEHRLRTGASERSYNRPVLDEPVALVALVGAPRSGTTWLQTLLGADPRIVSPQETSLFARYAAPLDESWRWGLRGTPHDWARRRFAGLAGALTEDQFVALVREFVQGALSCMLELKPGACIVLEKTPGHSMCVDIVARYAPQVRFVHIIRDGRDVAASLVAASEGWGSAWGAPKTIRHAAKVWLDNTTAARAARAARALSRDSLRRDREGRRGAAVARLHVLRRADRRRRGRAPARRVLVRAAAVRWRRFDRSRR